MIWARVVAAGAAIAGGTLLVTTLGWTAFLGLYLLMWANNVHTGTLYQRKE